MAAKSLTSVFEQTADSRLSTSGVNTAMILLLIVAVVGIGCGVLSFFSGHHAIYNTTREIPWGILISTYAFLAIVSTGLCIYATISHLFGGNRMAVMSNRMVFMSIIVILGAFATIGVEIVSPHRMILYNIVSPNPMSNIWWMGTLYGLAVGCMVLEFFSIITGVARMALILGIFGAVAEVAANSCLGGVFATLPSRPYWYGAQLPIYFLLSAFLSGAAAAVIFNHLAYTIRGRSMSESVTMAVTSASKAMTLALILYIVATFWRLISFFVGGTELGRIAAGALVNGPLSLNFWGLEIVVGMIIPIILIAVTRLKNISAMSLAAFLILVGQFIARYDLVVVGQIVPQNYGWDGLPKYLSYVPSVYEFGVIVGGFALILMGFLLGERMFGRLFDQNVQH